MMMDIRAALARLYKALRRIVDAWDKNEEDMATHFEVLDAIRAARQMVELGAPVEDLGAP